MRQKVAKEINSKIKEKQKYIFIDWQFIQPYHRNNKMPRKNAKKTPKKLKPHVTGSQC